MKRGREGEREREREIFERVFFVPSIEPAVFNLLENSPKFFDNGPLLEFSFIQITENNRNNKNRK